MNFEVGRRNLGLGLWVDLGLDRSVVDTLEVSPFSARMVRGARI